MWDIEEGDESTASPVTHSPLATCPRVTPLDCRDNQTLDELSSGLEDEEEEDDVTEVGLTTREADERLEEVLGSSRSLDSRASVQQLQVRPPMALPPLRPLEKLVEGKAGLLSRQGSQQFGQAATALETHYRSKLALVTEKLRRREEEKPAFLSPPLRTSILLVRAGGLPPAAPPLLRPLARHGS